MSTIYQSPEFKFTVAIKTRLDKLYCQKNEPLKIKQRDFSKAFKYRY